MYKFEKFPKEIKKEIYLNQENDLKSFLSENKNIISLYSIGELGLFGVSDLDYLIIHKNKINKKEIKEYIKNNNLFLIDTILYLNINEIKNLNYLSHHFNYNLIYGKDFNLKFDKNNKNLNIIYAWKICFFSLLRNFYWYKYNKKFYIKNLLSQINDIRYPIFFLENLGINNKEYINFLNDFGNYRKSYFKNEDYKKLEKYLDEAIKISWNIVFDLSKFLGKNKKYFIFGRFPTIFENFLKNEEYINKTEKKLKKIGKISRFLYLPTGFNYKNWDGKIKNDLDKIIKNNKNFLNFGLDGFILNILLFFKKIFDFITIKLLK